MPQTINVTLTNDFAWITDAPDAVYDNLKDIWSYSQPGAYFSPIYQSGAWDGRIRFFKKGCVSSGLFRATYQEIEQQYGYRFKITHKHQTILTQSGLPPQSDPARYYQNESVAAMMAAIPFGGGIVLGATRTGKTAATAIFFSKCACPCLFIVDQIELLDQSQQELTSWLKEPVGIAGRSVFDVQRVTVATIQTLKKHKSTARFRKWLDTVQIVVVDELHEMMAKKNYNLLATTIQPIARFGLTATLQTKIKRVRMESQAYAGPIIYEFPISKGIEAGVLVQGHVLQLRFPRVPIAAMDAADDYANQVLDNRIKLEAWQQITKLLFQHDRHVVTLVWRVPHVDTLSSNCDHPHRIAYGKVSREARGRAKQSFERGKLRHLIANQVFKKGVTIKAIDAMFDLAELKSKNDCVQKFGRGIGLCEATGKQELLYIDFATQGDRDSNLAKAARSRVAAFKAAGIPVTKVNVLNLKDAVTQASKWIDSTLKTRVDSLSLPLVPRV